MKDDKERWQTPALRKPQLMREGLSKRYALPVFASNALSSVSYAPDQILLTLGVGGIVASGISLWVGVAVFAVMAVVIISYRQVVLAYPRGGGDYEVARQNLGQPAALITVSALLVDYSLTIAVSTTVAGRYLSSLFPSLSVHPVWVALGIIVILTGLNLSGMRESGKLFAIPAYLFMA
ncbi:amino acid permease, partial [Varibaculum cambriense]